MALSIWKRKRDLIYLIFFLTHIPIMFCVDLTPLYPVALKPAFMTNLRKWYITTYRDQFFSSPPAWFDTYIWLEALYHVPLSFWAVPALLRNDPKVPLHLLVFALEAGLTTLTCIADYLSWSNYSATEKIELGKLYVPYLALAILMGLDMFYRLSSMITRSDKPIRGKKTAEQDDSSLQRGCAPQFDRSVSLQFSFFLPRIANKMPPIFAAICSCFGSSNNSNSNNNKAPASPLAIGGPRRFHHLRTGDPAIPLRAFVSTPPPYVQPERR
ncbi:hypothetical protein E4T47_00618 [Aureobasidium subglaciale]|nr:hypothetical protein E4T47_00618 [Aureobasidium subglaciale]